MNWDHCRFNLTWDRTGARIANEISFALQDKFSPLIMIFIVRADFLIQVFLKDGKEKCVWHLIIWEKPLMQLLEN